jgi:hypothetical protein
VKNLAIERIKPPPFYIAPVLCWGDFSWPLPCFFTDFASLTNMMPESLFSGIALEILFHFDFLLDIATIKTVN